MFKLRSRIPAVFVFGVLLAAYSGAQKVFVNPHVLTDSSGNIQGILWDPVGGQPQIRGTGTTPLAGSLRCTFSLYGNDSVFKWLVANVNGTPTAVTFDIYSLDKSEPLVWTGVDILPESITLPGCDVDSHDPTGLRAVGRITFKAKEGATVTRAQDDARKQKLWTPSAFRLRIGDLPCSHAVSVDPIECVRTVADLDGDGVADVYFNPKEYSITVPASDGPAFQKAFESGVAGTPLPYAMQLDYLDPDGNTLLSAVMICTVVAAGRSNIWMSPTDPDATYRVILRPINDGKKGILSLIR
jgi:hypothetical protein